MLRKTYKKLLSTGIALSLGFSVSYTILPNQSAYAFNWGNAIGAVAITGIQYQQLEKQLNYLDSDGRHEYFNQMKSELGENTDPYYNTLLDNIMNRLTYAISLTDPSIKDKPYNYFINPSEEYNAFCTVGHNLSVNTGMFKLLNNNEDELAIVIAHELAHGEEEHVQSSAKKSFSVQLLTNLYASQNPNIISIIGANVLQNNMIAKGITKVQEQDADDIAFNYATSAGYNIGAGAATWQRFIDKMGESKTNFVGELFSPSDHPSHQSRRDNYSDKLTDYSNNKVKVDSKTGMISVNRHDFITPVPANDMSSQERAYLIAGNLAAVYHNHPKNPPEAYLSGNTIYMGNQAIMVVEYGENGNSIVNKLNSKFKAEVVLSDPKITYRETITKTAVGEGRHKKQSGGHGQFGHVFVEFSPNPDEEEMVFAEKVFGGAVPKQYFPAVETGLRECCQKGPLAGYKMVNVKTTLLDGKYHDVDSSEMAFKMAAHLAYKDAMTKVRPILLEPIMNVKIRVPDEFTGAVIGDLNKRRGSIMGMTPVDSDQEIDAQVPMANMSRYCVELRSMTTGLGTYTMKMDRYDPVPEPYASRVIEDSKKDKE